MEPEIKKLSKAQNDAIESFQIEEEQQNKIIRGNINKQILSINERLQNRKSKSLLGKKKRNDKSFDIMMRERMNRRDSDTVQNNNCFLKEVLDNESSNHQTNALSKKIIEPHLENGCKNKDNGRSNRNKKQILPVKKNKKKFNLNSKKNSIYDSKYSHLTSLEQIEKKNTDKQQENSQISKVVSSNI
jgi:hypothetical protein